MSALRDKIWLTWHTRIYAEKRFRLYDVMSKFVLTYLSLLMIATSIFANELENSTPNFNQITIVISVGLFAISLLIAGSRFSETAGLHRQCYLKLQALGEDQRPDTDVEKVYYDILSNYPNHHDFDYYDLVLSRTLFQNKRLNSGQEEIQWNWGMLLIRVLRLAIYLSISVGMPFTLTIFLFRPFLF